jgi:site-specific DNA-methyltransferase (adenine-specific)
MNKLFYGDNLEVLRRKIKDETVDLCYIDPPFNSKRNYFQIFNNIGGEDRAQAQAFTDTWTWDDHAIAGFSEILGNDGNRFTAQTIELIKGLHKVLKEGSLLAYLIHMALRIVEIRRVLKPTGSFYLHCDPTASHYLKLVIDGIFVAGGGDFQNEIIWGYSIGGKSKTSFGRKHDVILFYTKSKNDKHTFNEKGASIPRKPNSHMRVAIAEDGRECQEKTDSKTGKVYRYFLEDGKIAEDYWTDIQSLNREDRERMGYPTQKPEALLSRILKTSSNEGDTVLDAYCGCGTTIAVAERLKRKWIGIDITYQSVSLILRRLEGQFDKDALKNITLDGVPQDMESACALANKKDDRVRKEFEKWAVLTYTNNRAIINEKKGADAGVDGVAYFKTGATENAKMILQVKSGGVGRGDIAKLRGDMGREGAEMAALITLEPATAPMQKEAKAAGVYFNPTMQKNYDRIEIVTIKEIIEQNRRLELPMNIEVVKTAQAAASDKQISLIPE